MTSRVAEIGSASAPGWSVRTRVEVLVGSGAKNIVEEVLFDVPQMMRRLHAVKFAARLSTRGSCTPFTTLLRFIVRKGSIVGCKTVSANG